MILDPLEHIVVATIMHRPLAKRDGRFSVRLTLNDESAVAEALSTLAQKHPGFVHRDDEHAAIASRRARERIVWPEDELVLTPEKRAALEVIPATETYIEVILSGTLATDYIKGLEAHQERQRATPRR
jgi:hypothetical protein